MASSVEKVLDILMLFSAERTEISIEDIQNELMLSRSTVYRYVQALQEKGFLHKSGISSYRPGLAFIGFSRAIINSDRDLRMLCMASLKRLSEATHESISLMRILNKRVVCVESIEGQYALRVTIERGRTQAIHAGASSKALLAHLPQDVWLDYLDLPLTRFTATTITDVDQLAAALKQIRAQGYAVSDGEIDAGARAVATPLLNSRGEIIAALSIEAPKSRMDDTTLTTYIALLKAEAETLSLDQVLIAGHD